MVGNKTKRCPKCHSPMTKADGSWTCSICSYEYKTNLEKGRFWEEHREEITKDLERLGWEKTIAKWGIGDRSMYNLCARWKIKTRRPRKPREKPAAGAVPGRQGDKKPYTPTEVIFTVCLEDLARLSDLEFNDLWGILGRIVRARRGK